MFYSQVFSKFNWKICANFSLFQRLTLKLFTAFPHILTRLTQHRKHKAPLCWWCVEASYQIWNYVCKFCCFCKHKRTIQHCRLQCVKSENVNESFAQSECITSSCQLLMCVVWWDAGWWHKLECEREISKLFIHHYTPQSFALWAESSKGNEVNNFEN